VLQVIDWAQRQAGDSRTYAVALVCDDNARRRSSPGDGRGLVWLLGMDGNDSAASRRATQTQERMLARRLEPVGIPPLDRMPRSIPSLSAERIRRLDEAQPPR
jgi:hypothetical protein